MRLEENRPLFVSDEKLSSLYANGVVPFPQEDSAALFQRSSYLENLALNPTSFFLQTPHTSLFSLASSVPWFWGFYKSRPLPFWIAALTWIVPTSNGFSVPCLQLSRSFSFLMPSKEEIIAHETVHAIRANFNEPRFEEILAYRTSKNLFRKLIGPLFQTTTESNLFLISTLLTLLLAFFSPSLLPPLFTSAYLSFLSIRLFSRHKTLSRCLKSLKSSYKSCEQLIYHLTDKEIELLAKKGSVIRKKSCLRWRQINVLYSLEQ